MRRSITGTRAAFVFVRRAMRLALKKGDPAIYSATASAMRALTGRWDLCSPATRYGDQSTLVTRPGVHGRQVVCYRWSGPYYSGTLLFRKERRAG